MKTPSPLNDAWLFWNAERLEDFPHESENDVAGSESDAADGSEERPGLRLLENMFLYAAGISAAMVGVGFAVLIGSFISAYAALNLPGDDFRATAPKPALERSHPGARAALPETIVIEPAGAAAGAGNRRVGATDAVGGRAAI